MVPFCYASHTSTRRLRKKGLQRYETSCCDSRCRALGSSWLKPFSDTRRDELQPPSLHSDMHHIPSSTQASTTQAMLHDCPGTRIFFAGPENGSNRKYTHCGCIWFLSLFLARIPGPASGVANFTPLLMITIKFHSPHDKINVSTASIGLCSIADGAFLLRVAHEHSKTEKKGLQTYETSCCDSRCRALGSSWLMPFSDTRRDELQSPSLHSDTHHIPSSTQASTTQAMLHDCPGTRIFFALPLGDRPVRGVRRSTSPTKRRRT